MAYTVKDYPTKKALIEDFKSNVKIKCYQPGGIFPIKQGPVTLEGPHYPKPHRWYASGILDENFYLVALK